MKLQIMGGVSANAILLADINRMSSSLGRFSGPWPTTLSGANVLFFRAAGQSIGPTGDHVTVQAFATAGHATGPDD